jgi:hypothetical protein
VPVFSALPVCAQAREQLRVEEAAEAAEARALDAKRAAAAAARARVQSLLLHVPLSHAAPPLLASRKRAHEAGGSGGGGADDLSALPTVVTGAEEAVAKQARSEAAA